MMIWTITRKELLDNLRDRKGLREAILIPVLLGIAQAFIIPALDSFMTRTDTTKQTVAVVGLEHAAPDFAATMDEFNIELVPYTGDAEALQKAVSQKDEISGLVLAPNFDEALRNGEPSPVTLYTNQTAGNVLTGGVSNARLLTALEAYNQRLVATQLAERGIDPGVLQTLPVQVEDVSTPAQRGGTSAGLMLTLMAVFMVATGGLYIAIDVTAGEKERGTLESLFVTPVSDVQVLLGKALAVNIMSLIPMVLAFAGFYLVPQQDENDG